MLFALKKILTAFILPPGIFILWCAVMSVFLFRRREFFWRISFAATVLFYLLIIPVTSSFLISRVEYPNSRTEKFSAAQAIVVAGGGIVEGVKDLSGESIPVSESSVRLLDAARLFRIYGIPVIVSGGPVLGSAPEAVIDARFLKDLGVPGDKIVAENKARDTRENARYVKEICDAKKIGRVILVTSAFHMKRAKAEFEKTGLTVLPFASGSMYERKNFSWSDLLPSAGALRTSTIALKEIAARLLLPDE